MTIVTALVTALFLILLVWCADTQTAVLSLVGLALGALLVRCSQ